ncbi:MAG: hypothetical protein ACLQNE_30375 [Thermoguttaceae bacterium]
MDAPHDYCDEVKRLLPLSFSDHEKDLVRLGARHYSDKGGIVAYDELYRLKELGRELVSPMVERLKGFGLFESIDAGSIKALPACVELVHAWDNPPTPDYRDKITKWFWSKRWSAAVYIVVVVLPALVCWIAMLKTLLEWLGIVKGSSPM